MKWWYLKFFHSQSFQANEHRLKKGDIFVYLQEIYEKEETASITTRHKIKISQKKKKKKEKSYIC